MSSNPFDAQSIERISILSSALLKMLTKERDEKILATTLIAQLVNQVSILVQESAKFEKDFAERVDRKAIINFILKEAETELFMRQLTVSQEVESGRFWGLKSRIEEILEHLLLIAIEAARPASNLTLYAAGHQFSIHFPLAEEILNRKALLQIAALKAICNSLEGSLQQNTVDKFVTLVVYLP